MSSKSERQSNAVSLSFFSVIASQRRSTACAGAALCNELPRSITAAVYLGMACGTQERSLVLAWQ